MQTIFDPDDWLGGIEDIVLLYHQYWLKNPSRGSTVLKSLSCFRDSDSRSKRIFQYLARFEVMEFFLDEMDTKYIRRQYFLL